MRHHAIGEIAVTANKRRTEDMSWALRRRRLERLAHLLEFEEAPLRLFSTMECYPRKERLALRQNGSLVSLAYLDAQFRREGLAGDTVGDAVSFFGLSIREAHALLCDCRYGGLALMKAPLTRVVAARVRRLAAKRSAAERVEAFSAWLCGVCARIGLWAPAPGEAGPRPR